MTAPTLTLTATLRPAALDARRGIVRLHPEVIMALGLRTGDPVTLTGRRVSAGLVAVAAPGASRSQLYADDLLLGNLGLRDGGEVKVAPAPVVAATRVDVVGPPDLQSVVSADMLRFALLGKLVSAGDDVSLLPQDVIAPPNVGPLIRAARASLRNTVGFAWTSALLTVIACEPEHAGLVTMDTVVGWRDGQSTHNTETLLRVRAPLDSATQSSATATVVPPVPSLDDLPGLRKQARELTELLDLGFHHSEVLGKLGTTISLGVLVTGPNGSGKSAMVRAVAGAVSASVTALWAPEVAALTNNDAATRLRAAASTAVAHRPSVLLISDIEALMPRDEAAAPLATVFRQVVADMLRAGVAVICTTGRPEAVDPSFAGARDARPRDRGSPAGRVRPPGTAGRADPADATR